MNKHQQQHIFKNTTNPEQFELRNNIERKQQDNENYDIKDDDEEDQNTKSRHQIPEFNQVKKFKSNSPSADIESPNKNDQGGIMGFFEKGKQFIVNNVNLIENKIIEEKNDIETAIEKVSPMLINIGKNFLNEVEKDTKIIKDEIVSEFHKLDESVKSFLLSEKKKLNQWVRSKVEQMLTQLLRKAPPYVKEAIIDPFMFEWLKLAIADLVDDIWPDVEEEILFNLRMSISKPFFDKPPVPKVFCLCVPFYHFRRWWLYTIDPYDLSTFQRIRTFSWWMIFIIQIFPLYGVQTFAFALQLILQDKRDEFQLVKFILKFKALQFFTDGCLNGIIGYVTFFNCATMNAYITDEDKMKCITSGAGSSLNLYRDIGGTLLKIVLIWVAFLLLPFSKEKGEPKFKYTATTRDNENPGSPPKANILNNQQNQQHDRKHKNCICCNCYISRGGRLKCFMLYDIFTVLVLVGLFFLLQYLGGIDDWKRKQYFYMLQVMYGIFSFPFLIFLIPFLRTILTKSRNTAYNAQGQCIPAYVADLEQKKALKEEKNKREALARARATTGEDYEEKSELLQIIHEIDFGDVFKDHLSPSPNGNSLNLVRDERQALQK